MNYPNGCVLEAVSYITGTPADRLVSRWKQLRLYSARSGTDWRRFVRWAATVGMEHVSLDIPMSLDELAQRSYRNKRCYIASTNDHVFVALGGLLLDNGGMTSRTVVVTDLLRVPELPPRQNTVVDPILWTEIVETTLQSGGKLHRPNISLRRLSRRSADYLETYIVRTRREVFELDRGVIQGYVDVRPEDRVMSYLTMRQ